MNLKLGMDTAVARTTHDSMQAQLTALADVAASLGATSTAASFPQAYGIAPGEPVVAPWSIGTLQAAHGQLLAAQAAAHSLLQRLGAEADGQEEASGTGTTPTSNVPAPLAFLQSVSSYRSILTRPRGLLDLPAAVYAVARHPETILSAFTPRNYVSLAYANTAGGQFKAWTRATPTPRWIRGAYVAASNLKFQNLTDPKFIHGVANHRLAPPTWLDKLHVSPAAAGNLKTVAAGVGKGFAALSVVTGAFQVAEGFSEGGSNWDKADGIVNIVTGIGSFAPPPVGLVFAGVGAAYNIGRMLFSGEAGDRPVDHIVSFGQDAAANVASAATTTVKAAATVVNAAADVATDVVDKLWPW